MAQAILKVKAVEVTLSLTGEEAAALYRLLCFTNTNSPTDGVFEVLTEVYPDLPPAGGEWELRSADNGIDFVASA